MGTRKSLGETGKRQRGAKKMDAVFGGINKLVSVGILFLLLSVTSASNC